MASSSSNRCLVEKETPFQYPYPPHVLLRNFVTVNLAGADNYGVWKTQMSCLLVSHDMTGFIDGRFLCPDQPEEGRKNKNQKFTTLITKKKKGGDNGGWIRSNALVKGWILGSLSEQTLGHVVNKLNKRSEEGDFTAKEVWDKLHTLYGSPLLLPPPRA
nr:hypothetical protein [Tanacetum cinerariifolium]